YSYLGYQQPLLFQLIPTLASQFADVFPELQKQEAFVTRVIREEEEAFLRTLGKGITRFSNYIESALQTDGKKKIISGAFAFELNDTYGFPVDLTELMGRESGWTVDKKGYEEEMKKQKDRSRAATTLDTGDWTIVKEGTSNEFIGYDTLETKAQVLRYRKVKSKNREAWQVVLDKTPFYAESGGQVGDTGTMMAGPSRFSIIDTRKENDLIIHIASEIPSQLDNIVTASVDAVKRKHTAVHHTATHLLHAALRKILGTHVAQKGSLVNADYLRFDFSHFSKMTDEEIRKVEEMVNEKIRENIPVVIRYMAKDEAVKTGAMALFGEKYGDTVRVVTIDPSYSIELCGGTHAGGTGELGFFKITSESAIAAGVRRIEAVSGLAAEKFIRQQTDELGKVREALKNPADIMKAIQNISDENAMLKKSLEKYSIQQLRGLSDSLAKKVKEQNGYNFLGEIVEVSNPDELKKLAFDLKQKILQPIIVLAASIDGKAHVVLLFDEQIAQAKDLDAGLLIKQKIGPIIKGGGGGQKTFATAGGQDTNALSQVIETVKSLL
ncbi:MAG: alanine--tRNA ligase, partial [Flavisolibacter sp.]